MASMCLVAVPTLSGHAPDEQTAELQYLWLAYGDLLFAQQQVKLIHNQCYFLTGHVDILKMLLTRRCNVMSVFFMF